MSVTLALLTAHAVGDFPLQPTEMAADKLDSPALRFAHCIIHGCLVGALLLPTVPAQTAWRAAGAVLVLHFVIDSRRWVAEDAGGIDAYPLVIDQTLHLMALYLTAVVVL